MTREGRGYCIGCICKRSSNKSQNRAMMDDVKKEKFQMKLKIEFCVRSKLSRATRD